MFASLQKTRERRPGVTLIELLVVIAVIGLVIALLLPMQRGGHGGAFKNSCRNNMKQLGLALQNHNDTYKTFPPLMFTNVVGEKGELDAQTAAIADRRYAYYVRLLPFIEEDAFYKEISTVSVKFSISADDPRVRVSNPAGSGKIAPAGLKLTQLICPSFSGDVESTDGAASNYVALTATTEGKLTPTGVFDPDDATNTQKWDGGPDGMIIPGRRGKGEPMSRMSDGTSKTAVLVESREGAPVSGATSTTQNAWYKPSQGFVYAFPPSRTPGANDVQWTNGAFTPGVATALNFGPSADKQSTSYKVNAVPGPATRNFGPSSDHMGGIIVHAMGDGSVQEITPDLDPGVYYAVITTAGREDVTPPWAN